LGVARWPVLEIGVVLWTQRRDEGCNVDFFLQKTIVNPSKKKKEKKTIVIFLLKKENRCDNTTALQSQKLNSIIHDVFFLEEHS